MCRHLLPEQPLLIVFEHKIIEGKIRKIKPNINLCINKKIKSEK
jgi:hypothetical protein